MKKRLLSFLLCLAILAGQIPAAAFAAEDTPLTESAAAETTLAEQKDAKETPAPAAEEEPETQQPAPTGEAAPEQTPDQQPTQQPEAEGSKGAEAAPTPEEQPVPPPENVADQGEAQPEQQPAEGAGPADANSEETEEQPGDSVVTYTITFTDELGTASDETGSEITQAAEGTLVTITAKDRAEEGLLFTAWQAPEGLELADDTEEITTFTMPDSNVELAAEYAPLPEDAEALAEEEEIMLADASPVSGDGTESNPYQVSTYEQLKAAVDEGSANIKLMADIDTTNENSGVGVTTATNLSFKGSGNVLDLNGHELKLVSNMSAYFIKIYSSDLTIKDSGTNGRIEFIYGDSVVGIQRAVVISRSVGVKKAGSLTVDGGTLSSTYHGIILIESFGSITINGGRLYAPVTNSGNSDYLIRSTNRYDIDDTLQLHVNGGELDGRVVLIRDDSSATGTLKYKVTPIKITGGTFKQGLYATWKTWDSPEGAPKNAVMTMDSPTIEITGGVFERNNEEYSSYASSIRIDLPTKLRGGTFKNGATIRFVGGEYTWDGTQPQYRASIGNSAILCGNDIRTAYGWSKSDWFEIQCPWIFLSPKGGNSVTVIPNAWGMKSVTLDGTEINYAKDWKGGFEELYNDTAHTIKFKWKDLAPELSAAGYSYNATCDRYISGSTTPTTDTISATDTEYSFTIPADAAAKVYSFALHLNLKKTGSPYNVGIYSNEHIVKLVVNQAAPVEPVPTLAGKVYYTSGIVFGRSISTGTGNLPTGFDSSKLRYQWQRSTNDGRDWTNIEGATSGQYTPKPADMGKDVHIRVVVTANGYLGEIVGAAVKVSKADNNNKYPEVIKLEAVKNGEGNYNGFKITNFDSDCE